MATGEASDIPDVSALIAQATAISKQFDGTSCNYQSEFTEVQLDEFRSALQTLRHKLEFWKMQVRKYPGYSTELAEANFDVGPTAVAALKVLQDGERRTRKLNQPFLIGACLSCSFSRRDSEFPVQMTEALQSVIDGFNGLPKPSKSNRKSTTDAQPLDMFGKQQRLRQSRLPFGLDKRYIPLRRTATKIRRALENQYGPQVVVLHGSSGSGKSSLARYIALQYQKAKDDYSRQFSDRSFERFSGSRKSSSVMPSDQLRDSLRFSGNTVSSQTTTSSVMSESMLLHGCRFPGGVFYVPCTPVTTIIDLQLQLLQDLGFTPPIARFSHLSLEDIHSRLQDKLMEYLGKKDALVVIDNVSNPYVVRKLLLPGTKVRYLVTTQDANLCEEESFETLGILNENLSLETARKILATHTRLSGPEAQEVFDALINLTGNPVALMYASMTILHKDDVEEWKEVRNNLEALMRLSSNDEDNAIMALFPRDVPRSIACTMTLALESLPVGVEKLLVALAALEGPSVPQVVVQLILKSTEGHLGTFSRSRNVLEDRAMIRLHSQTVWWSRSSSLRTTRWYIDALLQRFIQSRKAKAVASMVDCLFDRCLTDSSDHDPSGFADSDYTLTVALCAVYGSPSVAEQAANKLGASRDDLSKIWAAPLVSLLQATEPRSKEEKRRQEIHNQARQVFLAYVYDKSPDIGMRGLLSSPVAVRPTCWSVAWAVPNKKRALFARSIRTVRGLVNLLGRSVSAELHECATAALWNLSMAAETKAIVAKSPGLLDQVVRLLGLGTSENLRKNAAGIVASLASDRENQETLVEFPDLVSKLVLMLTDYASPNSQGHAAHAIMYLATSNLNKQFIAAFPGALEGLVELMHGNVGLHETAVGAVMNLSTDPENKPVIAKFPGALEGLVKLLADSPSILAQKRAAATLISVSTTRKFLAIRLFPQVLEKLVGLLSKMDHPEQQEIAVKILGNLAMVEENAGVIANFPGAWRGLLRLLRDDVTLDVKMQALDTIGLLAAAVPTSKVGLSGVSRAMQELLGLVGANRNNPNYDILEKALLAIFRILDTGEGKNFVAISKFPGALYQLVNLLGEFEYPELQEMSAAVLASLAKWKQNRMVITHCPRALGGLVDLLADSRVKPGVQTAALKTLWHVAYREDENRRMISEFPGSLQRIVELLEKDAKPAGVQVCAALVLSTLTGVEGEDYVNPDEVPGVLDILAALLTDEDISPKVQQEVAKARTLLDWESTNSLNFISSDAYAGRGRANAQLGMLKEALSDFDVALRSMWDIDFTLQKDRADDESIRRELQGTSSNAVPLTDAEADLEIALLHGKMAHVLSNQAYVKAVLKDYGGGLRDADSALELQPQDSILWQERGVLKRLMGDLPGAMADLEASLQITPNNYETLKHYGYSCFLRDDHHSAYTIAEHALEIDLDQGYDPPDGDEYCRLGKLPVSYLDFILR